MNELEPPPSHVELVVDKPMQDATWKTWLYNLSEFVRGLVAEELDKTAFGELAVAEATDEQRLLAEYLDEMVINLTERLTLLKQKEKPVEDYRTQRYTRYY